MNSIPAHKQTDPAKKPGQMVNPLEGTPGFDRYPYLKHSTAATRDKSLSDYLNRKYKDDAFNTVKKEQLVSFEQWYAHEGRVYHPHQYQAMRYAWETALLKGKL